MAITINGTANTVAGLAVGGLPDGTVDADTLASGTVGGATGTDYNDDVKVRFGTGNDFEIYHDDGNSKNFIAGNNSMHLHIQAKAGEESIVCYDDGGVDVYHDNNVAFKTQAEGIRVDGTESRVIFGSDTDTYIKSPSANKISFTTGGTERSYLASDGQAVFKCANSFFEIDKTNTGVILNFTHNASQVGNIGISSSDTSYNTSSDYRLKENVAAISDGITRIKQLKPSKFNWIADDTNTLIDGFLAHEVSSVVPNVVTGAKDAVDSDSNPVYQCIDHSKLVPLLTAALKEAITKIETLETKVAALEAG